MASWVVGGILGNRCKVLLDTVLLSFSCREDKLSIYVRSACILDLSYTSWVTKVSVPINIIIIICTCIEVKMMSAGMAAYKLPCRLVQTLSTILVIKQQNSSFIPEQKLCIAVKLNNDR